MFLPALDNFDLSDPHLRLGTEQINMQQAVIQPRAACFYAFCQNERLLKLA